MKYAGKILGVHLVTVLLQSLDDFISELKSLPEPAVLGGEVKWERALNSNAFMRTGGLNVTMNFEEAPPVTDIGVYMGRYEAAFDILASEIEATMQQYNVRGDLNAA